MLFSQHTLSPAFPHSDLWMTFSLWFNGKTKSKRSWWPLRMTKLIHGRNDPQNLSILSNSETFWERFPEAYRKFPFLLNIAKFALLMSEALLLLAQSHRSDLEFRLLSLMSCGSWGVMYVKRIWKWIALWFCSNILALCRFHSCFYFWEFQFFWGMFSFQYWRVEERSPLLPRSWDPLMSQPTTRMAIPSPPQGFYRKLFWWGWSGDIGPRIQPKSYWTTFLRLSFLICGVRLVGLQE